MPRVNWHLSPEAKAIFEAFKSEKGLGQDDAANRMILEFADLRRPVYSSDCETRDIKLAPMTKELYKYQDISEIERMLR